MNFLTITGISFSYGFKSVLSLRWITVLNWSSDENDQADLELQSVIHDSICMMSSFQNFKGFVLTITEKCVCLSEQYFSLTFSYFSCSEILQR